MRATYFVLVSFDMSLHLPEFGCKAKVDFGLVLPNAFLVIFLANNIHNKLFTKSNI